MRVESNSLSTSRFCSRPYSPTLVEEIFSAVNSVRSQMGTLAEVTKVFGPAKLLLLRVGDRQPVQQTLVVPQRQRLWLVVGLPVHRSLPPSRSTVTQSILYHTLL